MAGAAAPILIGSAIGAATNRENPLKGALLGGALGGAGSAFAGFGSLGNAAANTASTAGTTAGTGSALTGAGASTAANTAANTAITAANMPTAAFINPAGVNAGANAVMGASQIAPVATTSTPAGVFSTPVSVESFTPLSSAQGQTAAIEKEFGVVESLLNPNIQKSSLNNESFLQSIGSGAKELGQYAQQNPVLTAMAVQTGQQMLQQPQRQANPPGLLRGNQIQAAAPQYQLGAPQVSLI